MPKVKKLFSVVLVSVFAVACMQETNINLEKATDSDQITGLVELSVPDHLVSVRAIDLDALSAEISVNGDVSIFNGGEPITMTANVPSGGTLDLQVLWYQTNVQPSLLLTSYSTSRIVTSNDSFSILPEDYISEGEAFDADNDSFSNLSELESDSDPLNSAITPENRPNVRIQWVNPTEAPVIDGLYESIWGNATFSDVQDEPLSINNLMINQGALRPDGSTEFRWFAMHDDSNLYIFVLAENVELSNPIRDSSGPWNDDNINLFVDGNNSKLSTYDGVDDRHLFVPFLVDTQFSEGTTEDSIANDSFFQLGSFSASVNNLDFAACLCSSGQHTWEFKLPFADFGIVKNVPFGFDIQLDLDHDGGARDARWGWFHPSRTTEDVDNTWTTPSFMGTAIVE